MSEALLRAEEIGNRQTKSSLIKGMQIHSSYKLNEVIPGHAVKEYTGINGIRPDFVDFDNYIIYELKPGNKNSVFRGYKQLEKYKSIFEKERPGTKWKNYINVIEIWKYLLMIVPETNVVDTEKKLKALLLDEQLPISKEIMDYLNIKCIDGVYE